MKTKGQVPGGPGAEWDGSRKEVGWGWRELPRRLQDWIPLCVWGPGWLTEQCVGLVSLMSPQETLAVPSA